MKLICDHTNKRCFPMRMDAMRALATIRQSVRLKGPDGRRIKHRCKKPGQKRVYYCHHCNSFHLTSWRWWFLGSLKYVTGRLENQRWHRDFISKQEIPKLRLENSDIYKQQYFNYTF